MIITRGEFIGTIPMPEIDLAIDLVGDGLEFTSVYELAPGEEFAGRKWSYQGKEYGQINTYRFDCSDLKDNAQWSDLASWHIYAAPNKVLYAENLFAMTYASKTTSALYANSTDRLPAAVAYVPWADANIQDASVFVQLPTTSVVIPGQGLTIATTQQSAAQWRQALMPSADVSGPSVIGAGETATYSVTISRNGSVDQSCNSDVVVEATGGYLPLQRVKATGGQASFRVVALGLQTGDKFKLKVGFRNYSSLASKNVEVT